MAVVECKIIDNYDDAKLCCSIKAKNGNEISDFVKNERNLKKFVSERSYLPTPENSNKILIGEYYNNKLGGCVAGHIESINGANIAYMDAEVYIYPFVLKSHAYAAFEEWCKENNVFLIDEYDSLKEKLNYYDKFMDFINNKISFEELSSNNDKTNDFNKEKHSDSVYNVVNDYVDYHELEYIIRNWNNIDEKYHEPLNYDLGISIYKTEFDSKLNDEFKSLVMKSPLYKLCFNIYDEYLDKKISDEELYNKIVNLNIDFKSTWMFALEYAKCAGIDAEKIGKIKRDGFKEIEPYIIMPREVYSILLKITDHFYSHDILYDYGEFESKGFNYGYKKVKELYEYVDQFIDLMKRRFIFTISSRRITPDELEPIKHNVKKLINNFLSVSKYEYEKKLQEKNLQEKKPIEIETAQKVVKNFLNTSISLKQFLIDRKINKHDFECYLKLLKQEDIELYNEYKNYMQNKKAKTYAIISNKAENIIDKIKNGVVNEETNEKRSFDILDYYIYTNFTPDEFIEFIKDKCSIDDLRSVRQFFAKNKNLVSSPKIVNEIRKSTMIVNNVEVTDEQKDNVLRYLKSINAPISTKIFKIAMRRYLNNELNIEKEDNNNIEHGSKNR